MKRILFFLIFFGGLYATIAAQNSGTSTVVTKSKKTRVKSAMPAVQKPGDSKMAESRTSSGLKKDGTPDMRLKVNKQARDQKNANASQPVTKSTNSTITPVGSARDVNRPAQSQNNSRPGATSDKVFGQDAKGRTIYEGPRGGHYYINSKGNKEYVKKGQ